MAQGPVRVGHFYPKRPLGQLLYKPNETQEPQLSQEDMTLAVLGKEPLDELPGISLITIF